ncbi:zinc finger protein gcs1 [Xylona heveae TC161]|uniref:Zinc finger protein gcs1 n=1 Tax=Xylona heveae (strain CBS 132557 / TC161) TaxID=1328760 RepID=A0A165GZP8_XYLHT|nr:zinc finger protein gcs1 [Xylona heveae TC161]KZF22805.1 zinc finger protein gcs1 [Xylona heveae TC161]
MWEVDPETKSKLLELQKRDDNSRCCDCDAPSPQWASPKFGIFICLTCAGTHRGLGVHISFVRSVSMDAFKVSEVTRMQKGGNKPWKEFFDAHELTKLDGRSFEECTIAERYSGDVGEEYKERLSAKAEGREYVPQEKKPARSGTASATNTGPRGSRAPSTAGSRTGTPVGRTGHSSSPAPSMGSRKAQNESYFAKLGDANAARSADLPPSQGGRFTGFGSAPREPATSSSSALPGVDDFQRDPMAALTKGFGWFTSTVGKSAKTVNDGWIQPTAQKLAEGDLAAKARLQAMQLGKNIQAGGAYTADSFNRFVEGPPASSRDPDNFDESKRDFWDNFGGGASQSSRPSAIGTTAMRGGGGNSVSSASGSTGFGNTGSSSGASATKSKSKEEGWDDEW